MEATPFSTQYHSDEDDKQLIENALSGDKSSLEKLIQKHQPFVYNIAWKMVQNPHDAQDITQEVLIKIITKLSNFEQRSQFRTWLYRIVVNHFLQMKKQTRETVLNESFDAMSQRLNSLQDVELSDLEQKEKETEIREMNLGCMSAMLLCLTREQRLVYIIGELFNADHSVGAEMLNISKGNYRVRLSRAKKDLFHFMNNQCGLVNKSNPCRCYKKVTTVMNEKVIDSKSLLFNRKEYSEFRDYISKDADDMLTIVEEKYRQLHYELPFRKDFDKKTFIDDFLKSEEVNRIFNLN
ncbi:MAG: RNA polymerase sigma factor [Bacteroidota bacterium]